MVWRVLLLKSKRDCTGVVYVRDCIVHALPTGLFLHTYRLLNFTHLLLQILVRSRLHHSCLLAGELVDALLDLGGIFMKKAGVVVIRSRALTQAGS